jgi:NADPH-dependent ferric siderophore reductase
MSSALRFSESGPLPQRRGERRRRLLDRLQMTARLEKSEIVGPRMRQITLRPTVGGLPWTPGQHVQVEVADRPGPLGMLAGLHRTYTVWDYNSSTMQLCVFDHGDGPGSAWARQASPGDEVLLTRPQGNFVVRPAAYHLFAGEETASVAYGAMLRNNPDFTAYTVIEIGSAEDALPLPGTVHWNYRGSASAVGSQKLLEAVRSLDLPAEPGAAYLAGEARTIQMIRAHLVNERRWPRRSILTKPFWAPGKTGLE